MRSTDLVKYGNRPELLFRVTTDGQTYQKEVSFVFPRYMSADLPRYKEDYEMEEEPTQKDMKCNFVFE